MFHRIKNCRHTFNRIMYCSMYLIQLMHSRTRMKAWVPVLLRENAVGQLAARHGQDLAAELGDHRGEAGLSSVPREEGEERGGPGACTHTAS